MAQLFSLALQHDQDVVTARQRAAHIAQLLGYDVSEQTRIATAVSEIVRNAFRYARGGTVQFEVDADSRPQRLQIRVQDRGPGIPELDRVLAGKYQSRTGMGIGIAGARRLMDRFEIHSSDAGTTVMLEKFLPVRGGLVAADRTRRIAEEVAHKRPQGLIEEIQQQNQELLRALDELQRKQQELVQLNRELEDTNRGVVALYAELDEKADHLRRADELKSRFLSNMTHEFRTPVNSIIGLSNLLVEDRGRHGQEPEPEVLYIRKAAEQLSELVNDLLDLAKVEAGKTVVRPGELEVDKLFGALRGMLRPLLLNQSVALVFDDVRALPHVTTDEGKVSQILRNLISNALKFTERGEVRVSAHLDDDGDTIAFTVADSGIGIAPDDIPRIFEEFTQVEHRLQRHVRGTGLGLPLSKRLAELLGGSLSVRSEPGAGSIFTLRLPVNYRPARATAVEPFAWEPIPGKLPLLIVEDSPDTQYFYDKVLKPSAYQIYPSRTLREAEAALDQMVPAAVILDILLGSDEAWDLLLRLKRDDRTSHVPVVVVSGGAERQKAFALGADAFLPKPLDRRAVLDTLVSLQSRTIPPVRTLVIDDQEVARFLIRKCLPVPAYDVTEAASAEEGLRRARHETFDLVLLDLVMADLHGAEVLRRLRQDPATRDVPVIIVTSTVLDRAEEGRLRQFAAAIVSKADLSRETLGDAVRGVLQSRQTPEPGTAAGAETRPNSEVTR
jgi:signal transduction histidine kinase/CheY-like chemotaxis protein